MGAVREELPTWVDGWLTGCKFRRCHAFPAKLVSWNECDEFTISSSGATENNANGRYRRSRSDRHTYAHNDRTASTGELRRTGSCVMVHTHTYNTKIKVVGGIVGARGRACDKNGTIIMMGPIRHFMETFDCYLKKKKMLVLYFISLV